MNNSSNRKQAYYTPGIHHVRSHYVSSYVKKDGTYVNGFWRDGDGNSKINTYSGYIAKNPRHSK